jgi:CBS domain-containing protein
MVEPSRKGVLINDQVAENITRTEELAYELKISEVMTRDVKALTPDMPMREVVDLFRQVRISGAPVIDETNAGWNHQYGRPDPLSMRIRPRFSSQQIHDI